MESEIRSVRTLLPMRTIMDRFLLCVFQPTSHLAMGPTEFTVEPEDTVALSTISESSSPPKVTDLLDDILRIIFNMLMDPPNSSRFAPLGDIISTRNSKLLYRHLIVMQVCRRWRALALHCAFLWSRFICPPLPLASISRFLKNSLRASWELLITLNVPPCFKYGNPGRPIESPDAIVLLLVLRNLYRVRVLGMRITDVIHGYAEFSTLPAPCLEELTLIHILSRPIYTPLGSVPRQLFAENVPRLRRMTLQNYLLQTVPVGLLKNLTHLTLFMDNTRYAMPLDGLLQALASCPMLENFEYHDLGIPDMPQGPAGQEWLEELHRLPTVKLPHLLRLTLASSTGACYTLLRKLVLSASVTWRIYCQYAELYEDMDIWSVIPRTALSDEELELHSGCGFLMVTVKPRQQASLKPDGNSNKDERVTSKVIRINWSQHYFGLSTELRTFPKLFHAGLSHVKDIYLAIEFCSHDPATDAQTWRRMFSGLPMLEHLYIIGGKSAGFGCAKCIVGCSIGNFKVTAMAEALAPTPPIVNNGNGTADETCLCPRLRSIEFAVTSMGGQETPSFEELTASSKCREDYGAIGLRWVVYECQMSAYSAQSRQMVVGALSDQRRFWKDILPQVTDKRVYSVGVADPV